MTKILFHNIKVNMYYDKFKKRENKNEFCTAGEIDERQALELAMVLDRWLAKDIDPCDVILEVSYITGARASFLTSYSTMKEISEATIDELKIILEATHISETEFKEIKDNSIAELDKKRCELQKLFRPETLNPNDTYIVQNIKNIQNKLENCDFSSWEAAIAISEVILSPTVNEKRLEFKKSIESEIKYSSTPEKNIDETIETFKAETEEEVKRPLAHLFAKERAYKLWKQKQINDGQGDFTKAKFEVCGCPGSPNGVDEVEFVSTMDFPNRTLCDEIHITPSGTGLIEVYERDEYTEKFKRDIYGENVARITTYSVSFVPKNPNDMELLRGVIEEALSILGSVPYKYELSGSTPSGNSYKRPKNDYHGNYYVDPDIISSSYIHINDGKVMPQMRFDLDDLWRLYYILEPIIEPSEQVAIAMNMARRVEERGAILEPDDFNYINHGHHVENESGYLKKGEPEEILPNTLRDIFTNFALDKIDEAELMVQMSVLANHTLTGQITAPNGSLPTYAQMIENQSANANDGVVSTYAAALKDRTLAFMRCAAGLSQDSNMPISSALSNLRQQVSAPLKECFRAKSQENSRVFMEKHHEQNMLNRGRDVFAKLQGLVSGYDHATDKTTTNETGGALANVTNLVVVDSKVETCIDGIHANGRYISRTRNSLFVRKELPNALKPFMPSNDNEFSAQLVLNILRDEPDIG